MQLGYLGGAYAMVIASVSNIVLTVGYVLAYKLVPRTWGRLTMEAFKVPFGSRHCVALDTKDK